MDDVYKVESKIHVLQNLQLSTISNDERGVFVAPAGAQFPLDAPIVLLKLF